MKFLLNQHRDAAYNLAMEEYILENRRDDDYFILWINEPSIIVGKFQNVYQEINVKEAYLQHIPVYRRNSGGGCVFHDEGNLNFSFITDWKMEENIYSRFLDPIIAALKKHNIPVYQNGICNLSLDGKKISGNAQAIHKKRLLHHGTLLFDTDLHKIRNVLKPDYEHYISNAMKSVNMPVMNISDYYSSTFRDIGELQRCILRQMGYRPEFEFKISSEANREIENNAKTKYRSWDWNYAKAANFKYSRYFHAPAGSVRYEVENGVLKDLSLEHEQLSGNDMEQIAGLLVRKRFCYPEIHEILKLYGQSGELAENILFPAP